MTYCCTPLQYGHKRGHVNRWDMASDLVGDTKIELVTSSVSTLFERVDKCQGVSLSAM